MSIATIIFDHLEQDTWTPNNTTAVNPIPFDSMQGVYDPASGALAFSAVYSKNYAGGLLGHSIALPVLNGRKFQFAAMNVRQLIPAYLNPPVARNEMDLKWTFPALKVPAPNQANGSSQIRPDTGQWQLDPTGGAWVDSGYVPSTAQPGKWNVFQTRIWSDGTAKWSVTGLQCNAEPLFVPGAGFENLPLINTNWTPGLVPQLQWEGVLAPFAATVYYARVQVVISENAIPMLNPDLF